jgi:uncharacterized protein YidB (DUF937 family)
MGLLDGLLGQVTSSVGGTSGQQTGLAGSVLNMLTSGQQGGLQGLIQTMREKGLSNVVESWVGTGPNQPISPDLIQRVLGNQKLQELATQHGMNLNEISSHLAQILPVAVDKLTPNGTLPSPGGLGDMLKGFSTGTKP